MAGLAAQAKKGHSRKVGDEEAEAELWTALLERAPSLRKSHSHARGTNSQPLSPRHPASSHTRPVNGVVVAVDRGRHGGLPSPGPI